MDTPEEGGFRISKNVMAACGAALVLVTTALAGYSEIVTPIQETRQDIAVVKSNVMMIAKIVDRLQTDVIALSRENAKMQSDIDALKARLAAQGK